MKVKDLISILEKEDGDSDVWVIDVDSQHQASWIQHKNPTQVYRANDHDLIIALDTDVAATYEQRCKRNKQSYQRLWTEQPSRTVLSS